MKTRWVDAVIYGITGVPGAARPFDGAGSASTDARIILAGIKNSTTQVRTKESNYIVWKKMVNQGSYSESLALPSFTGPSKPTFSAPGGLEVQIPAGEFRSQSQTLATQPGMGYLNELAARNDVNWQPVKLAFDQWNYKQQGLTPAGAALVAVAVTWAIATDATFRKQVGSAVKYINWCTANPSACNKDQLQKAAGLGILVLGPVIAANSQLVVAILYAQNRERAVSAAIGGRVNALALGLSRARSSLKTCPTVAIRCARWPYEGAAPTLNSPPRLSAFSRLS